MQSMNQCLFGLWKQGILDESTALAASNNPNDLRVKFKTAGFARKQSQAGGNPKPPPRQASKSLETMLDET